MVSILLFMESKSHLPSGFGRVHLPAPSTCFDTYPQPSCWYPQPSCWCRLPARSDSGLLDSQMPDGTNRTHVEDVKNLEKVPIPTGNLVLVALCEHEPRERIPFTLLANLPFDLCHGSGSGTSVSGFKSLAFALLV
jgi:hypothetical protein